jgi:hypothetical protein
VANHTRKFTPAQRKAIADDIRATAGTPEGSYRQIAKRHDCALGTIQNIAKEYGLTDAWQEGQQQTAAATSVKQSNAADRRAALQLEFLDDVAKLRSKLFGEVVHLNVVKNEGPMAGERVKETYLRAGPRDWRDTANAIAALTGKSIDLARLEAEQAAGEGEGAALLRAIAESLGRNG